MAAVAPPRLIDNQGRLDAGAAVYLMLSLTRRCNMRCPGCYYLQQDPDFFENRDLDLERAREIVRYYHGLGIRQAIPNAEGDVLLHEGYPALIEYIGALGFRARPWLVTNGIRLPDVADFVVRHVGEVLISVDGPTAEKYNAHRGGNEALFRKVLAGIRTVVAAKRAHPPGPEIIINCVLTADRAGDLPDMIRLAETLGVDTIKFTNFHVTTEDEPRHPITAGDPATDAVLRAALARRDYRVNIMLPTVYGQAAPPFTCKMLASVNIGSNGDFAPCCRMAPEPEWGNFYSAPEKHDNPALRAFRLSVVNARSVEALPVICRKCSHLSPRRAVFLQEKRAWYITSRD